MKVSPVSADMLIKLALGAVAVGVVWYGYKKISGAAGAAVGSVVETVSEVASTSLNPASDQNLIYRGINAVGGAAAGSDSWSLGSWIYDLTHSDPLAPPVSSPAGHTAYWKS